MSLSVRPVDPVSRPFFAGEVSGIDITRPLSAERAAILGWPVPEARQFLRDLIEHATQRRFVYAHAWRQWDLVVWDNRATMHRARPFPADEVRDMHRTTVACERSTMAEAA